MTVEADLHVLDMQVHDGIGPSPKPRDGVERAAMSNPASSDRPVHVCFRLNVLYAEAIGSDQRWFDPPACSAIYRC